METMNKEFYNRMLKSTKKLHDPEPQNEQLLPDSSFESKTPKHKKNKSNIYRCNSSTVSDQK